MLDKINNIKNWQASIVIGVVGLLTYSTGLFNPFEGDDTLQIINNPVVHSLRHFKLFFDGSTFIVDRA